MITPRITNLGYSNLWTDMSTILGYQSNFEKLIAKLFANNEQGFFYDPNDLSTMYQNATGTVPVTAVGQPVGRILDKSGRDNHATQSTSSSRPILRKNTVTGANYLEFDGVNDYLIVAKNNLKFLHDGTGVTGFVGFKPSGAYLYHTLLQTNFFNVASKVGYTLAQDDRVSGKIINVVANGSGTLHVNNSVVVGKSANPRVVSFKNKLGTHVVRQNGTQVLSSSTETGSPSTSVSANDLYIGQDYYGYNLHGNLYGVVCINRLTTDNETLAIEKELAKRMGVTLSV